MGFNDIIGLYEKYGNNQYMIDEEITQLQHVLQAAHIAKKCKAPPHIIIGLLLHDIGQLVGRFQNKNITIDELHASHDDIGALWLQEQGFTSKVTDIAKYHTLAKILLCDKDPSYLSQLSTASQQSYIIQKEKYKDRLNITSIDSDIEILMACRLIDDMSKINNYNPGCIEDYESMYLSLLIPKDCYDNNCKEEWIGEVWNLFKLQTSNYSKFIKLIMK